MEQKSAAIYLRVSTHAKTSSGDFRQNPDVQKDPLLKLASARGWTVFNIYSDRMSGSRSDRPAYRKLLDDARKGKFQVVVVLRLDRWARSLKELISSIEDLKAQGIEFVCADQPIDTTTAAGKLMYQIVGAFAEFERSLLIERTRDGIEYARENGTKSGKSIGRQRRVFNRDLAVQLRAEGMSYRDIARRLGVGKGTVERACPRTLLSEGIEQGSEQRT
jgi:DNA invertase Pin-like site-specific DNA recombinase